MSEYACDSCGADLSNLVQVRCAVCTDYDLCVPCFARGVSSKNHKPWHDYRIIERHAYPIFTDSWGADEELLLVEGCEQFGLGSWQDISEHIGGRSKEEVGSHYEQVYMSSPTYPIPDLKKKFDVDPIEFVNERQKRVEQHNRDAKNAAILPRQTLASVPACHDIQGYMPGRLEFDVEAENDAEMSVKDMVFEPDDSELDIEHKLTVLGIYNSRLARRTERKRTIFTHNLLDYRHLSAIDKRRTKEERDLANRLKPYVRLLPLDEYNEFCESMLAEQHCRQRISELQEYRQQGLHTLAQAARYEKEKQIRLANNSIGGSHSMAGPGVVSSHHHHQTGISTLKIRKGSDLNQVDAGLLSPQERSLCAQLHIQPRSYLGVKEAMFQALVQTGGTIKRRAMRDVLDGLDDAKVGRIFDFFQSQHWL